MRAPLLMAVAPMFLFVLVTAATRKLDPWSFAAGAVGAVAVSLIMSVRDDAPQHVLNWRRGAEGERKTERALRRLERDGWVVKHDIQQEGRANLDHLVTGPRGIFLLETKNLSGTISVENGVLVARQFDDPNEIYRYRTLASRLRGQARDLSARLREETDRPADLG
ncbi:MAG TPA: nuclease-related domain-containing protein [Gaiellaceae bacterium]|nr:nuclease-related domain-containing protein [Gaiellaceae bacterium]